MSKEKTGMDITVTVLDRPDFDKAVTEAVQQFKDKLNAKDDGGNYDHLWSVPFTLVSMAVEDNYKRREYAYNFNFDTSWV